MSGPLPRQTILEIAPYVGGRASLAGQRRVRKLSANESALGPSPLVVAACREAIDGLGRYPDGGAGLLREAIGERFGLAPERIVCGNGSDDLLALLGYAYAGPGNEVVYSAYGFLIYPIIAQTVGAKPVAAPEKALTADVDALLAAVNEKTRIVYLANPNNPTGTYLPSSEMVRLRAGLPENVLLVIDAAYAEYVTATDYEPGIELVDAGENVVMTRTFSKIYALSALRLGWAYCPPAIADILNRIRGPFNVNAFAQAAGRAALADRDHEEKSRLHNETWRAWLTDALGAHGLVVHPSVANFILVEFPDRPGKDAVAAERFLHEKGLIPRRMDHYGLARCLRITIGSEEDMRQLADVLGRFVKDDAGADHG